VLRAGKLPVITFDRLGCSCVFFGRNYLCGSALNCFSYLRGTLCGGDLVLRSDFASKLPRDRTIRTRLPPPPPQRGKPSGTAPL
jgi:hypothetical protein